MSRCLLLAALCASLSFPQTAPRVRSSLERIEEARLEAVHAARAKFAAERKQVPETSIYHDYRAVIHVHAEDADHTKGTRSEVLKAAKETGVQIVLFSDHRGPKPETWRGMRDGVLFLAGSEENNMLRFPGEPELKFLSHLEQIPDRAADGFDGTEIYNRHADAEEHKEFTQWFSAALKNPAQWQPFVAKLKRFPDEIFNASADYQPLYTRIWDKEAQRRVFTGIAANDSHQNVIYNGATFDPYPVSFRSVMTHLLARELSEAAVRASLKEGRAYVAHEWLADPTGFVFVAGNNLGIYDVGDTIPLTGTTRLSAQFPLRAHLKLFRNGVIVSEQDGDRLDHKVTEPGAYRIEAWLDVDGEQRPWIYSNAIYAQKPDAGALRLPSAEVAPNVKVQRDIVYTEGKPDDAAKHKLDIYSPADARRAPVVMFVHGGAWRSGDRSLYTALGNRFAKGGLVVAVPSYRLAPANPHPAQIEDVAAAFAWVRKNIAQYGGDPERLYIAGHSAGGHLAALLALDERWLGAHGLKTSAIRGVVPMSGVYAIAGLDSVFGTDPAAKRQASPMTYVRSGAPPFVITYCQWDYATLPLQAERLNAALQKAGVSSKTVFVPRLSHITEMTHIADPEDLTAKTVLDFVK